jgi:hypothetical protein
VKLTIVPASLEFAGITGRRARELPGPGEVEFVDMETKR